MISATSALSKSYLVLKSMNMKNMIRAYFSAFGPKLNFPEMLILNLKILILNLKILKLNLKPRKLPNIVNFTPIIKYLFWNVVNIASKKFDFSLKYKKLWICWRKNSLKIQFVHAKTQFENAKTQFEYGKVPYIAKFTPYIKIHEN